MSDLAGTNSIEYYLKGRALKQNREAQEAAAIARQQKMEQDLQIAKERQSEIERWHGMQDQIAQGRLKNDSLTRKAKLFDQFSGLAKARQEGLIEIIDPNQITVPDPETGEHIFNINNIRLTPSGTAAGFRIDEAVDKAKALGPVQTENRLNLETGLNPILASRAGEIAKAQLPAKTNFAMIQSELAAKAAQAQRDFTASENAKNRAAQRANVLTRAESVYSNKAAKQEEKNEVNAQMTEDYLPDILSGAPEGVLEALPKGEKGLKLRNSIKAQGYSILTRKQAEHLEGMKRLQGFHDKAETLRALIADGTAKNFSEIRQLQDELAGDLVIFGREAKAEKGVVTDKDIDRLRASIPQMFPGGAAGLFADKNKANKRRVDDIKKSYHEKVRGILGGKLKLDQKRAIYDRYQLIPDIPEHLERVE